MKLFRFAAIGIGVWMSAGVALGQLSIPWQQPSSELADGISGILGPGQARLTIRNLSAISTDQVPAIRRMLEQDLKAHGIQVSGAESANAIRVTLSEDARERLWVAEVIEGSETQVTMVRVDREAASAPAQPGGILLRSQTVMTSREPVLSVLETANGLIALEPEQIVFFTRTAAGWSVQSRSDANQRRSLPRDPRGMLLNAASGNGFEAWLPGVQCTGNTLGMDAAPGARVHCQEGDDPWPVLQSANSALAVSAFYNPARNYFTGVVTPGLGIDLPAFYSAAVIPRAVGGAALLIGGIDGKVKIVENGALKTVAGTRDWGSDLAVLRSGCSTGTQIVVSSSGEAASDSLRAYEMPALEAVPASAPMTVNGTVTALWSAPDGRSVIAVIKAANNQYEVDRVSALCN